MNNRRIGLLGATSLVGECLQRQLMQKQWHIVAFSRRPHVSSEAAISWLQLDGLPLETETSDPTLDSIPYWICAAPLWVLPHYFDMMLKLGVRRIVALSSTSRYSKTTSPDASEQRIAQQLITGEEALRTWATQHDITWVVLRPTLIYGYGRDKNITEIARFILRFGFFPVFGSAQGLRQPIHVDDVATACCSAISAKGAGNRAYDLTGGETLSYREMVIRVFEALGSTPRIFSIPLWLFHLALWGLKWLPHYRHWTSAMAQRMNQDLIFDYTDARQDLHFSPRSFKLAPGDLPSQN